MVVAKRVRLTAVICAQACRGAQGGMPWSMCRDVLRGVPHTEGKVTNILTDGGDSRVFLLY